MTIAIRSAAEIAKKFITVTPGRAADYAAGVQNPSKSWEEETAAAENRYEEGVQASILRKAFGKGVRDAGNAKWKKGATEKGTRRWPEGVRLAEQAYQTGFAPFRDVIANTTLPPRYPTGDERNIERVAVIAANLHAAKVGS